MSIATVSRFLNRPGLLNVDTAERVKAAMDGLGYIPHGNAGARSHRRVGRVGVLTPFFPAPSFVQRLQGMTAVFRRAEVELVIYTVESPDQLKQYLHSVAFAKRLDGIIVLAMSLDDADARRVQASGLEVVLVETTNPHFSAVVADNRWGGALAAGHLLARGYTRCGFLGEATRLPYALQPSDLRWEGYSGALAHAGFPVRPEWVRLGEGSVGEGLRLGRELLTGSDRPRAVFAMSDVLAIGVLKAARNLGLAVPGDVAVLGFDDIEAAEFLDLSTISQGLAESGRAAAELLVSRLEEPGRPQQTLQLEVTVVARATT